MDPHGRGPKKNTSYSNEVLLQDTMHLIQRPCYQQGNPCQDPAGNWTTRRPPDHHIIKRRKLRPLTTKVVWAPQMISQPVFSIFPCSPLPSGTCQTPGLSISWCCLPTSSSVCLVFFLLSLCLARWFWPDLMNWRHDHATAVCISLRS